MDPEAFISCQGAGGECSKQIARDTVTYAITAQPDSLTSFPVTLIDGTWWAYRDTNGGIDRIYCPAHHQEGARNQNPK